MNQQDPTGRTFCHRFKDGTTCEVEISPAGLVAKWSRRPKMSGSFRREYVAWQKSMMQTIADDTGQTIAQAIEVKPGKWEFLTAQPQQSNACRRANDKR